MAELAAVREPEWLKERRGDAARRAAELDLPRFKGKAGWEFTDITKLDLAAFTTTANIERKQKLGLAMSFRFNRLP